MSRHDKLTLAEEICGLQMVDGKKMITVADSCAQIDFLSQLLHEKINEQDSPRDTRDALHAQLDEQVLQAKERILRSAKIGQGSRKGESDG